MRRLRLHGKKLLTSVHFRRRVSAEEQRAQKDDRFLRGRQIAYIFGPPELMKLYKVYQIYSKKTPQNDDVQDFETRWDQALLSACEKPTEMVLEGFFKSKLHDSVQLQTVNKECSKQRTTKLLQIEDNRKTSY